MGRGMSGLLLLTILGTALLCLLYSEETIIPDTTTRDEATVAYRRSALVEINAPACNCSSGGAHSPGSSPLQQTGPTQQEPPRLRAVVTSLYTDDYIEAVRVLGHSIKQHNTKADMVMVYIESQVSPRSLCLAQEAGWDPRPVERVPPLEGVAEQFRDQYTKLRIWELDQYDKLIYLDADTLVVGDINDLFTVPHDFAAVPDTYQHEQSLGFNAGVMVIRPSRLTFQHLMGNLTLLPFDRACAEQSYLREYYKADVMLLPYKYNLNLAQDKHPDVWGRVWRDARVVHYTLEKPFRMESDRFRDQFALWYRARDEMAANGGKSTCA